MKKGEVANRYTAVGHANLDQLLSILALPEIGFFRQILACKKQHCSRTFKSKTGQNIRLVKIIDLGN